MLYTVHVPECQTLKNTPTTSCGKGYTHGVTVPLRFCHRLDFWNVSEAVDVPGLRTQPMMGPADDPNAFLALRPSSWHWSGAKSKTTERRDPSLRVGVTKGLSSVSSVSEPAEPLRKMDRRGIPNLAVVGVAKDVRQCRK
mmetsp:Transcript_54090/g.129294  ORF Transcript_54090/g.129294 Transcript_54090/m.129294 type:complete len:140 (-) Transcript_54090:12-431(-)